MVLGLSDENEAALHKTTSLPISLILAIDSQKMEEESRRRDRNFPLPDRGSRLD